MPIRLSALGNFNVKMKTTPVLVPPVEPPANLLFATSFDGITVANPTFGFYGYADRLLTGTDLDTGYGPPTGAPLYALSNGYRMSLTAQDPPGPRFNSLDLTGVNAVVTCAIAEETVLGQPEKVLTLTAKANTLATAYSQQFWYQIYRNISIGPDLPEGTIRLTMNLGNLDARLAAVSGQRRVVIMDLKTGSGAGGDYRHSIQVVKANATDAARFGCSVGTVGWQLQGDSNANQTDGIPVETFFTVRVFNDSNPVPQSQFFEYELYWKRGTSYADTDNGRLRLRVKKAADPDYVTVFDVTKANLATFQSAYGGPDQLLSGGPTVQRNIHMGSAARKIQRMMLFGIYGEYTRTLDFPVKVTRCKIYDGSMVA